MHCLCDAEYAPRSVPYCLADPSRRCGLRLAPAAACGRDEPAEPDEWQLVGQVQAYLEARRRRAIPAAELIAAWERFYRTYRPVVVGLIRGYGPDIADLEDAVQEAWIRLLMKLACFRCDPGRGPFRSWLRVLVRHVWLDQRRRRDRAGPLASATADRLPGREEDPALGHERRRARDAVRGALAGLRARASATAYQVLLLHGLEDRPIPAVADRLRLSPDQARGHYRRAARTLRGLLEPPHE